MASFNSTLFLPLLVAISSLMAAPSSVKAQFPTVPRFIINGSVPCTPDPVNPALSASLPACADAELQLRLGTTTAATTTGASTAGSTAADFEFDILLGPISSMIESILSGGLTFNQLLRVASPLNKFITQTAFLVVDLIRILSNDGAVTNDPNGITRIINIRPEDFEFVQNI
ncbi:hypothetical protein AgCh_002635 [Apium graveolens]